MRMRAGGSTGMRGCAIPAAGRRRQEDRLRSSAAPLRGPLAVFHAPHCRTREPASRKRAPAGMRDIRRVAPASSARGPVVLPVAGFACIISAADETVRLIRSFGPIGLRCASLQMHSSPRRYNTARPVAIRSARANGIRER
ncbi:hypothetical protein [Burkholderia sp. RS02]|uniref:hypothetical protein n=1 Tax=unclassified Burkholderia TaxID=2613784 RepID=UPI003218221F